MTEIVTKTLQGRQKEKSKDVGLPEKPLERGMNRGWLVSSRLLVDH